MKKKLNRTKKIVLMILMTLCLSVVATANAEITSVSPDTATQGTTGLTVTFTLDAASTPSVPPADAPADSVMIGTIAGTSVSRPSQYVLTAVFDIPSDEAVGTKDASITFSPPMGDPLVYSISDAFTVTVMPDTTPSITIQPKSQAIKIGNAVTLTVKAYGSSPLDYQWQKDEGNITDATGSSYTIDSFAQSDVGSYRCIVHNNFGSDTSDAAELTVDDSSYILTYPVVDTGQNTFYSDSLEITAPGEGEAFYGQDAQYAGNQPSYTDNGDGTITDNVTGLMWQKSADIDGDGDMDAADKLSYAEAVAGAISQTTGGYTDWRLPTIKELYSLMDFRGTDPSGYEETDTSGMIPFIDTDYFDFAYGDTSANERIIDSQYASSTLYASNTAGDGGGTLFGLNLADGRIKGYGLSFMGGDKTFFVMYVRDNTSYGQNSFVENGDGTVTDQATSLMWSQDDSGEGMVWEDALALVETKNAESYLGYNDWRLPNAKELHSILDYTRSPATTDSAAIDPVFNITQITNEAGEDDYPWFWSGTTHVNWTDNPGGWGCYVAFGRALGYMQDNWVDVHGAGCQRSDPKSGDPADWPTGNGPQGDAIRIFNYVRLVRDTEIEVASDAYIVVDTGQAIYSDGDGVEITCPEDGEAFAGQDAQYDGSQMSYTDNGDGTITDNVTGLMWQQSPANSGLNWQEAVDYCESLELGGYDDWRIPATKELFSISDFSTGWPYLDTTYFDLAITTGEVSKDEQYWADYYVGTTVEGGTQAAFGVNHATGHIKAYAATVSGRMGNYVRAVRGGNSYGVNDFVDNGDGTITDRATGLMWQQTDSGVGMDWLAALTYAEDAATAGYDDWRLPNIKELQSIVNYMKSPSATDPANLGPAIDKDFFSITELPSGTTNINPDYGYFWSSTSAYFGGNSLEYYYAWYVAFGTAVDGNGDDFHGAGGMRFDTKYEGGPLGEGGERYYNYVRLVRGTSTSNCQKLANSGDRDCDCDVDLFDFASLAQHWMEVDCGDCNGTDITRDGNINFDDLIELVDNWLEGV